MKKAVTEIEVRCYGDTAESHAHDHHQLVLPLAGTLEMEITGQGGRVAGLRAAAIPGGEPHSFLGADENAFLIIDIPDSGPNRGGGSWLPGRARFWETAGDQPFIVPSMVLKPPLSKRSCMFESHAKHAQFEKGDFKSSLL